MAVAKYASADKAGASATGASVATAPPDNGETYGTEGAEVAFAPHAEANRSMNNKPARAMRLGNILFSL
jgi:hypothetical protein